MRTERGCELDSPTTQVSLFKSYFPEIHTYKTIRTTRQTIHAPNHTGAKLCMYLHHSEHTADCECVCCLFFKAKQCFRLVCDCVCVSFTYLGKVVFVLALLEGVAVEICCLIGQLCDDSIFHLIYWVNETLFRVHIKENTFSIRPSVVC